MTKGLTNRQKEILDYIQDCVNVNHYPPSVREIGEALGLSSPSTVHAHLNALEKKGYIKREGAKSRTMMITDKHPGPLGTEKSASVISVNELMKLPLVGQVAAGTPILAEQNIEEQVPVPKSLFGDANSFLLKVRGDSMIGVGIYDGDIVVVREQNTASDGNIVVALIDDSATVKTFYQERDYIRLQPQNEAMEPIFVRNVQIAGIVTGLLRVM